MPSRARWSSVRCVALAAVLVVPATAPAQVGAASPERQRCGTPGRDPAIAPPELPGDCAYGSTNPTPQYAPTFVYRIPVVVHVIQDQQGNGYLSRSVIQDQIDVLNEDFRALPGSPGQPGVDAMIEFALADTDPSGNPSTGVTYSVDDRWFKDLDEYWKSLAWDTERYVNIYTNNVGGVLGYVPDLPQSGKLVGKSQDRVVLLWTTVGRNAPFGPPYHMGRTATHELGHYLGLWHTFDGACGAGSCYTGGDLICDTEAEANPSFGCFQTSSCGTPDPIHNYMDYSDDVCMWQFTEEQARRMRCTISGWRPDVATRHAVASATSRTAGANPQSYVAGTPVLGSVFSGTVDPTMTGHRLAVVIGYAAPDSMPLSNGYVLLVDVTSPPGGLLRLPPAGGPRAAFSFAIPNDPRLVGAMLYTQAAHFGGAPGFALSNAQDLQLGL